MAVRIIVVALLGLATPLSRQASAEYVCDLMTEDYQESRLLDEFDRLTKAVNSSKKPTTKQVLSFLKDEGVNVQSIEKLPELAIVISTKGQHPLNVLARAYAEDGISIAFSPDRTAEHSALGSYIKQKKMIILEANTFERLGTNKFTITDLHELLHARVFRDAEGKFLATSIVDFDQFKGWNYDMGYGDYFSLSELMTHRQDVRLAAGKLRLWMKSELAKESPAKSSSFWLRWINYVFPKNNVQTIETVDSLLDRLRVKTNRLIRFNDSITALLVEIEPQIAELERADTPPPWLQPVKEKFGDERRSYYVMTVKGSGSKSSKRGTRTKIEFSVRSNGAEKVLMWAEARTQIVDQVAKLREIVEQSGDSLNRSRILAKSIRDQWSSSNEAQEFLTPSIIDQVNELHGTSSGLHTAMYDYLTESP